MPAVPQQERVSPYRRLPPWLQWGLPFGIAIALVVFVVVFVNAQSGKYGAEDTVGRKALLAGQKEGNAIMSQQQRPHTVRLVAGLTPPKALIHAITVWIDGQTRRGLMNGPVERARCVADPSAPAYSKGRQVLTCTITAAQVKYDFEGVVQPGTRQVTYCQKIEYAAQYGAPTLPLSAACT